MDVHSVIRDSQDRMIPEVLIKIEADLILVIIAMYTTNDARPGVRKKNQPRCLKGDGGMHATGQVYH